MPIPKISVIMPTFNNAAFLKEAVDSVLNQTYANLELVIIDNYSTDNTEQIVRSYQSNRIKYYKFANEGIIARSRNFGIKQSAGDLTAFLDSDDIWLKDKLQNQVSIMGEDQEVALVFSSFKVLEGGAGPSSKLIGPKYFMKPGFHYGQLIKANFIVLSSVLVKTNILRDKGLFDESGDFGFAEDYKMWLSIARQNKIASTPGVEGFYRIHPFNSNVNEKRLKNALDVVGHEFKHQWISKHKYNRAKANWIFREGCMQLEHDPPKARSAFLSVIKINFYNIKLLILSIIGLIFTFFPFIYKMVREKQLDKKIGAKLLNPQNL